MNKEMVNISRFQILQFSDWNCIFIKIYKMSKQVRVRFAPSPTGPLHIGGVHCPIQLFVYEK
jgi:glutamyl-tRNA synthetase